MTNNFTDKQFLIAMSFMKQVVKDDKPLVIQYNDSQILFTVVDGKLTPLTNNKNVLDGLSHETIRNILFNKAIEVIKDIMIKSNRTSLTSNVGVINFNITIKDGGVSISPLM